MVWYSIVLYGDGNGIVWHCIKWCVNGNNVKVGYGITRHKGIVRKNWQYCIVRYNFAHLILFALKDFQGFGLKGTL